MGKHHAPEGPIYRGYQCEACGAVWAVLELEEYSSTAEPCCLVTAACEGPVVALYPTEEAPPENMPVYERT